MIRYGGGHHAGADFTQGSPRPLEDHDLPSSPTPRPDRCAWFIEGPIDGASFRTHVEKVLLLVLRPGDIVVLENLGSHRSKAVRQLIRSVGAKLFFLPKYSLDLNPIEQVFAKLRHLLRKTAARTIDAVCAAIGHFSAHSPKANVPQLLQKLRICTNLNNYALAARTIAAAHGHHRQYRSVSVAHPCRGLRKSRC